MNNIFLDRNLIEKINGKALELKDYTVKNLSKIIQVKAMSNDEKNRIMLLKNLCKKAGADEVKIDGLGNCLARVGTGNKKLVIDAHIDTVDVGDINSWEKDPFSGDFDDKYVYGRGASDQLAGAASMITAIKILKDIGYKGLNDYCVWFSFTIIEEDCDGLCWKYLIEEEKFIPDFFISTEPTSLNIYRGHRGRMEMEVKLRGVSCHGSAPERGVSAAYLASRAALAIEKLNSELKPDKENFLGKGTATVSIMEVKGPSQCAVPDIARLYIDRRLTEGETKELAVEQVKTYISNATGLEKDKIEVTIPEYKKPSWKKTLFTQELYFPTWVFAESHPLIQIAKNTYINLFGKEPLIDKWTFSTNGVAVAGHHKIPSMGFGPGDEKEAHAPNEKVRIEDLVKASSFYAAFPYGIS
ncbi:MAG TPA: YgeY family selenium metabolism-linked hydrolase [Exilispira sp.]|nr:YgeY family selenium metabolism-linked hydrolase [Exilispira sp.]